jgi:Leucine-rich repeat (LRR) protein
MIAVERDRISAIQLGGSEMCRIIYLILEFFIVSAWINVGVALTAFGQSATEQQTVTAEMDGMPSKEQVINQLRKLGVPINDDGTKVDSWGVRETEIHLTAYEWERIDPWERRITSDAIPLITQLPDIIILNLAICKSLDDQKLSQLSLRKYSRLQGLYLSRTSVGDESLEMIGGLKQLVELSLSYTRITDKELGRLGGLIHLHKLSLRGTEIGDAGMERISISINQQLRNIDLRETQITSKGAMHLARLPHLEWLDVSWTGIDDRVMSMCSEFKELEVLILDGTHITDVGLQKLASSHVSDQLKCLYLCDSQITDKSAEYLPRFQQLKHLSVSGSLMTSGGVSKIRKQLPGLRIIADRLGQRLPVSSRTN